MAYSYVMRDMKKAYLFDLDGVVIDSERQYTEIWQEIERHYPTGVENFAMRIKGTTLDDILSHYFPQPDVRKGVEKMLYRLEGEMVYRYRPGSKQFLDKLKANKIPMALVTSSNSDKMKHLYRDIPEIAAYFDTIILGDMVSNSKPDPEGYLKVAEFLGVDPKDCVVVEDSLQGIHAGKNAGAYVIGITGTIPNEVLRSEADEVVESLEEIQVISNR